MAATRRVSRFLLASNQFARTLGRVKGVAFMPPPNRRLSVFDTTESEETRIWELGEAHVAAPRGRRLHARADVERAAIDDESLRLEAAPPPPEHFDVVGWPAEDAGAREEIALRLADRSRLVVNPSPS